MKPMRLFPGILTALLFAVPAARAESTAFSTFTVPVSGTLVGAPENVSCKGPVRLSVMVQKDALTPHANAIVTVDTTALKCHGKSTGVSYLNTGHAILTRILSLTDHLEASIAVYPDRPDGHLQARTANLALKLSYNLSSAALVKASGTLSSP